MNLKKLTPYLLILFFIGLLLIFVPALITSESFTGITFGTSDGAIGDTIGGTTAPFIGFLGVLFTFLAFYIQYEANQQLRKDIQQDRFETKFYEMLRLHKENVNEVEIDNQYFGRKAFVKMYLEFKFIYHVVMRTRDKWNKKVRLGESEQPEIKDDLDVLTGLSYSIFFFGVGQLSEGSMIYNNQGIHSPFMVECIRELCSEQRNFRINRSQRDERLKELSLNNELIEEGKYNLKVSSSKGRAELDTTFYPFDGHASKLGHYFRHLYQLIKFVVTSPPFDSDPKKDWQIKYEYIKTIRAQLSNHEQTMIYYNSFFEAGKIWWGDDTIDQKNENNNDISYFLDWRIIKNIPFNLTQFGKNPRDKFAEELQKRKLSVDEVESELSELFEWLEG
ncbi:hypothetical protein GCM10009122_44870 [Fulvivirga kasyanovii]|uniref:Phage abortive infection protein n=1 Tax=Fulvivirga kasyanovii TaxID=396812 RepID=A0ABW9RKT6_9BACT|nr:putative phage abortive infection protein [Fulvivirga kasyanovii]MTI24550.1 hypothetical protein [Fulvivirga kasyanovii]